jgi:hypothetical protein
VDGFGVSEDVDDPPVWEDVDDPPVSEGPDVLGASADVDEVSFPDRAESRAASLAADLADALVLAPEPPRSFLAQPVPLKWMAGAANCLRMVASAPHDGQKRGPGSLIP